ncbi:MAG TPA: ABC transporter substrate-binding protein, partial [Thermomicrobiales bacterium]|nr:ABC transporter substrate-binding protein [Thermomicrobiales bacterium]
MNARSRRTGLSRRDLLRSTTAGAAAVASTSLLAGGPRGLGGWVAAQEEEPQRGGVFRIMGAGDVRSLDPGGAEGSEDWWSAGLLLFNALYAYDANVDFYPDLAADLPTLSADGLIYTIPIRQGVKFHNGRELVADDVAFSLAWQLWPEVYSWGKTYMENVVGYDEVIAGTVKELSGVEVVDSHTIEITLKKPQAVFPSILSMSMNGISPKQETIDAGAEWGKSVVIGTGPFKLVEWKTGQQVIFERHAEYYKEGLPLLDRVELSLNVEESVQMLRWESGEAEHIHNVPPSEIPRVLSDDEFAEARRTAPSLGTTRLLMYMGKKPFDDLRVRQAVAMAIDKEFFSRSMGGINQSLEGIYVPAMLQYEEGFRSNYPYDPDKAKALLAEAGYGDGISGITMYGSVTSEPQLEGMQADLREIGIEVDLVVGSWADWRDRIRSGEVQLAYYSWAASFPDAYDYVSGWMTCASIETGYNDGGYCNQRIDELVGQAEGLPQTDPQRIAAYREIEELAVNTDAAMIGLGTPLRLALSRDYVKDEPLSGIYGWPILDR